MKRVTYLPAFVLALGVFAASLFGCGQQPTAKTDSLISAPKVKQPIIVEIVVPRDSVFDPHALYDMSKGWIAHNDIVQWKNHVAVYANITNPDDLVKEIKKNYPTNSIRVYDKPFYNFNRQMCADTITTKKGWTNIFLTANLVADPKLQQEYLDYHKTQFEKWPEVSKGFCNAQFQQLLVFKNGRQLMLVISIPKGKTLDELNPLTTKNNPRVDEWNKIMSKYQEGIPGTKKGETWVFLKEVASLQ